MLNAFISFFSKKTQLELLPHRCFLDENGRKTLENFHQMGKSPFFINDKQFRTFPTSFESSNESGGEEVKKMPESESRFFFIERRNTLLENFQMI